MRGHHAGGAIVFFRLLVLCVLVRFTGSTLHERVRDVGSVEAVKLAERSIESRWTSGQKQVREGVVPISEIRHSKRPGQGYSPNSPLYAQQQLASTEELSMDVGTSGRNQEGVPTTMRCIIMLTSQFFVTYTALFVLQTVNNLKILEQERLEKNLMSVAETLFFVPMLCILFLGAHLRALQLSQGHLDQHSLPQWWVKAAMECCSWSLLALALVAFISGALWGELWEATAKRHGLGIVGKVALYFKNIALLGIYGGFTLVCIGVCLMRAPEQIWGSAGGPKVSAAVASTIFLSLHFFFVHLTTACTRAANEAGLLGQSLRFGHAQELLKNATVTVAFSPMLCVLFITVRMRALQLDPRNGNPQFWVQVCFYICTGSVFVQTLLSVIGALLSDSSDIADATSKQHDTMARAVDGARLVAVVFLYVSVVAIIIGLYLMEVPGQGNTVPQMLPSVRCIVGLTTLYFAVYLLLMVIDTAIRSRPYGPASNERNTAIIVRYFLSVRAREAVSFCPMFCILFLCAMMRAQQLGGTRGAPQSWCVTFEIIATWAILSLSVARVDSAMPSVSRHVALMCTVLQYVCLFLLYMAAISVVAALFLMTPETMQVIGLIRDASIS